MNWESSALNRDALPRIDLSQERREERRRILQQSRRDLMMLGGLAVIVLTALAPLTMQVTTLRMQLASVEREADQVEKRFQTMSKVTSTTDEQLSRWNRYVQSREQRQQCGDALCAIAARMPASVYLEQLFLDSKEKRAEMTMTGSAESMVSLTGFVDTLSRTPRFTRVRLAETSADPLMGPNGVRFRVIAALAGDKRE